MLKTLAIVAVLTLGAGSAMAAEVGVRHSSGSQNTTITGGRTWSQFDGKSTTRTRSFDRVGGGAGTSQAGGGAYSFDSSRTRTTENFSGGSSNNFTGGSRSTFSETSIFSR